MLRSGALLVGCGLLALLGAILVHQGQGASWLIATSVALTVAGTALLVVAPYPGTRRPLRVQLVDDQADEQAVAAREILDAHARRHADGS
jgi:hypothetical protein